METGNNVSRPFDVFLSHSHMYADWVENLAIKLKDKVGLNIWLDKWRLIPGRPFITGMSNGMEQAKSCAVCIGVHSPKGWFRTEIHKALNQQAKDPTFAVIPVLLPDAEDINVNEFLELNIVAHPVKTPKEVFLRATFLLFNSCVLSITCSRLVKIHLGRCSVIQSLMQAFVIIKGEISS